jgi:hypothetical protein
MATTTIATIISASSTFPQVSEPLVPRPQYIEAFDSELDGAASLIVVEGDEGSGKSTLAAQYALSRPDRTFSLFVSGLSAFSRSPEFLLWDLCDQIHCFFHGTRMPESENPELFLRQAKLHLQRRAARERVPFQFVVDGLLELADADPGLMSLVMTEYLPLGVPGFKFLLTGDFAKLPETIRNKVASRQFPLVGFSYDEAAAYLRDCQIEPSAFAEIYRTFKLPGKLASIRRILKSGIQLDLAAIPTTFAELFAVEWNAVQQADGLLIGALALLAHSRHALAMADLSRLLGCSPQELSSRLAHLHFLIIDERTAAVTFVSSSFKRFAASKLEARRDNVLKLIIEDLYSRDLTVSELEQLPRYLELAGRTSELVSYLTPDYLSRMADQAQSISPVFSVLDTGIRASGRLKLPVEMTRFTLQRAALRSLASESVLSSEVEARLVMGEEARALTLAHRANLKEHRLALLAKIAQHQHDADKVVAPELIDEIKRLIDATSFRDAPASAVEIASDLVYVEPEIAIKLVEGATGGSQDYPLDVALANLSVFASDLGRTEASARVSSDAISEKITNPSVKGLTRALSSLIGKYAEDELLRRCTEIKDTRRAYRFWSAGP